MNVEEIAALPRIPESVGEWEDLLVRLEIVPRVVRNSVEEVVDPVVAARILAAAATREQTVGRWLEAAAHPDGEASGSQERFADDDRAGGLALRFASLRARTFAMVQRRGLEVWEWSCGLPDGRTVTVYQLLLWVAAQDGDLLAELRRAARSASAGC